MKSQEDNLQKDAVKSVGWGMLEKFGNVFVTFIVGVILSRLLPPEDFGLMGLGIIIIDFGIIFVSLGFGPSLIYRQNLTEKHIRVAYTVSGILGVLLAIITIATAPLAAQFFNNIQVESIVKYLSVIFIIAGLRTTSYSLLSKELRFKEIFSTSISSNISYGVVTIFLAFMGYGVWSLIIGKIIQQSILLFLSYYYCRHSIVPLFAKREFNDLVGYGSGITLSGIFNYFGTKGDYFVIGRVLGIEALGLYTRAYNLMVLPTNNFVQVISNVMFPTASRVQNDNVRLERMYLKTSKILSFILIPVTVFLAVAADQLIIGLYGENWSGAILPLQILAFFGVFRGLYKASASFLRAKGYVSFIVYAQVFYAVSMIGGVWYGAYYYGMEGATFFTGISIFLMWIILTEFSVRALNMNRLNVYKTVFPAIGITALAYIVTELIKPFLLNMSGLYLVNAIVLAVIFFAIVLISTFILPQSLLLNTPHELYILMKDVIPHRFRTKYNKLAPYFKKHNND